MFIPEESPRWGGFYGPADTKEMEGVPILTCPMCGGAGRIVDSGAVDRAHAQRAEDDRQLRVLSLEFQSARQQGESMVLDLLKENKTDDAKALASDAGALWTMKLWAFDEDYVRGHFLWLLRNVRESNPKLSWEDLRHITLALYPQMKGDWTSWQAFRMACLRAEPRGLGISQIKHVTDPVKGVMVRRIPVEYLTAGEVEDARKPGFLFRHRARQIQKELGKELYDMQNEASTAYRQDGDAFDRDIGKLYWDLMLKAVDEKRQRGAVSAAHLGRLRRVRTLAKATVLATSGGKG